MENLLFPKIKNSFAAFSSYSVVIWPSLGKPSILSLPDDNLKERKIPLEIIFLSSSASTEKIVSELTGNLHLVPLLGLEKKTRKAVKGDFIPITIISAEPVPLVDLQDPNNFSRFARIQDLGEIIPTGFEPLRNHREFSNFFSGKTQQIVVKATFEITKEVRSFLSKRQFVLFNLVQVFPDGFAVPHKLSPEDASNHRILPHSVCLTRKSDWTNVSIIHASDIHIAKRNDSILNVVKESLKKSPVKKAMNFLDKAKNEVTNMLNLPESETEESKIPIEERYHNPNNMFRRLVEFCNDEADKNNVDFLFLTGDLLDYCVKSDNEMQDPEFNLDTTNWERFVDIILNNPITGRDGFGVSGIEPQEELLVPMFTILGNHDYRVSSYALSSPGLPGHFGLRYHEALHYKDGNKSSNPLIPSLYCKMAYHQYINPYDDYCLKFGPNTYIFLDSGWDAFLKPQYLLMGDPSLVGFSAVQMQYMMNCMNSVGLKYPEGRVFLMSHAPILNPVIKNYYQVGLLRLLHKIPNFKLEFFKETDLLKQEMEETRSDLDLDYHAGVIAKNWKESIEFLNTHNGIALNGHTHLWREFRTAYQPKTDAAVFKDMVPETPFAIYWDDYSELFPKPDVIEKKLPLHLQTPALGFANDKGTSPPAAIRRVILMNNKITSLKVMFLQVKK